MTWREKRDREERIRNARAEMLGISRAELDRLDPPGKRDGRQGYTPLAQASRHLSGGDTFIGRECALCKREIKSDVNSLGGVSMRPDPVIGAPPGLLCNGIVDETGQRVDCYHARDLELQQMRDAQVERERRNAPEPQERKKAARKPRAGQLSLVTPEPGGEPPF